MKLFGKGTGIKFKFDFFLPCSGEFLRILPQLLTPITTNCCLFRAFVFASCNIALICKSLLLKKGDAGFFEASNKVYPTSSVLALPFAHPEEENQGWGFEFGATKYIELGAFHFSEILLETVTVTFFVSHIHSLEIFHLTFCFHSFYFRTSCKFCFCSGDRITR